MPRVAMEAADSLNHMRVAAIQLAPLPDAAQQRAALRQILAEPTLEGCRLIVLPEAAQRAIGRRGERIAVEPEPLDGPFVSSLIGHASTLSATIVAGMFEEARDPERPFNTTVVVQPDGLVASYRKIHLYDALGALESDGITPGPTETANVVTVSIDGCTLGIQTCFDIRFPEMSRLLVDAGADVLVMGAAWYAGDEKIAQWRTLTSARAIESTAYLIAAAQPGPMFCGTSRIVDPRGVVLAEAPERGPAILTVELDLELIAQVRASMPVLAARRLTTGLG